MNETVRFWLLTLYETEIEKTEERISNERLFGKGCKMPEGCNEAVDDNLNHRTQSIKDLEEYIKILESLRGDIAND